MSCLICAAAHLSTTEWALAEKKRKKKEVSSLELGSASISQVTHVVEVDGDCAISGNYSFKGKKQEQRKHRASASP